MFYLVFVCSSRQRVPLFNAHVRRKPLQDCNIWLQETTNIPLSCDIKSISWTYCLGVITNMSDRQTARRIVFTITKVELHYFALLKWSSLLDHSLKWLKSLDFAVTRFLMKLFRISSTEIVAECQHHFGFSVPSKLTEIKRNKSVNNYNNVSLF